VVLIVLDTTRADHLAPYGYGKNTAPNLTRFAQDGAVFNRAFAPTGITGPSHACLFTGQHLIAHGMVKNGLPLVDELPTMAEILHDAGYATAGFVSSFVLNPRFGFSQGFDTYDAEFPVEESSILMESWEGYSVIGGFDRRANKVTDAAIEWLNTRPAPDRPFFLFVHYFDPHAPYAPPLARADQFRGDETGLDPADELIRLYDAEIVFTDTHLGRLLDRLDALDVAENSIVIVTADHGEGLGERGYFRHALTIHNEEVHVPLMIRWPGRISPGTQFDGPVQHVDMLPTLLDLCGIERPDLAFHGVSFAERLHSAAASAVPHDVYLYRRHYGRQSDGHLLPEMYNPGWEWARPLGLQLEPFAVIGEHYGLLRDRWKYITGPQDGSRQLYDLETDPGERINVVERHPWIADDMHAALEQWVGTYRRNDPLQFMLSPEEKEALEALGYTE
jgi:arylsulfatase A-like enzyme